MTVIWNERRADGTRSIVRKDYEQGTEEVIASTGPNRFPKGVQSLSNGIIGGEAKLEEAKELDRKLGVADRVEYIPQGNGAYRADYKSVGDYEKWMRAHKRVNLNAGCGTPCPGDFWKDAQPEFE